MLIIIRKITLITAMLFSFSFVAAAAQIPETSASSAVLIDGDTAEILYEKNAYEKRSMASTTKIMTGIIAVESGRLDERLTVKKKPYTEGTAIGFNKGDTLTLRDICYAMLLESGNDAAVLTAELLSGTEEAFSLLMNDKAEKIGMTKTSFVTASGLDSENHYTTAYDMALLGAYAIKNSSFREICSTRLYKAEYIEPEITRIFYNHNRLLSSCEGVIGLKTGFTKKSGRCLVSACERNGKLLVAVTLNAPDDWNDHKKLYSYGYSLYENRVISLTVPAKINIYGGDKATLTIDAAADIPVCVLKGSELSSSVLLRKAVYAPVRKNDVLGKLTVLQNGYPVKEEWIVSTDDIDIVEGCKAFTPSVFHRIADYFKRTLKKKG